MGNACSKCGASDALERGVLFDDETARACMACGDVRVNALETVYSDNPHVDPREVVTPAKLDDVARAWVAAFPRRVKGDEAFMPATLRVSTVAELSAAEDEAVKAKGSLAERIRAAGTPGPVPMEHFTPAMDPFRMVSFALALGEKSALIGGLVLAEGGGIAATIAREWLAARPNLFAEVAASIHGLRPAAIRLAVNAGRMTASAADVETVRAAVRDKLARTGPHSSDVQDLQRVLALLDAGV